MRPNKRDVVQQKQHAAAASMLACRCQQTCTIRMRTWTIQVCELRTLLNLLHAFAQYIIDRKTTDRLAPVLLHHIANHESLPMLHYPQPVSFTATWGALVVLYFSISKLWFSKSQSSSVLTYMHSCRVIGSKAMLFLLLQVDGVSDICYLSVFHLIPGHNSHDYMSCSAHTTCHVVNAHSFFNKPFFVKGLLKLLP